MEIFKVIIQRIFYGAAVGAIITLLLWLVIQFFDFVFKLPQNLFVILMAIIILIVCYMIGRDIDKS